MNTIQNSKINALIQQSQVAQPTQVVPSQTQGAEKSTFESLLQDQLKVSGHAKTRMESRNIHLSQDEWNRVVDGVQKASAKGAKESLVMVDNVALVVSVKNRTVITAVDKDNLANNVFTNIDSAIIV
ncbi:MAG TPA: TIGR02530 family flagellar biosynthesis protein [Fimbriimonas sp.]|nr:TIGR02530 family flagellar biosynthesis protein [Fimbriimonas sp.]